MAERDNIGMYLEMNVRERVDYIYRNYQNYKYLSDAYKDSVIEMISFIKQRERQNDDNLGVKVQTSFNTGSSTERVAFENIMVSEMLEQNYVPNSFFDDDEDQKLITMAVFEWNLMRSEYIIFNKQLNGLSRENHYIVSSYLSREKDLFDLADEYRIEPESMKMRLHRIKGRLTDRIVPFLREYGFNRQLTAAG